MERSTLDIRKNVLAVALGCLKMTPERLLDMRQEIHIPAASCGLQYRHPSLHKSLPNEQELSPKIHMLPLQGILL
jgi:hypothetical protein